MADMGYVARLGNAAQQSCQDNLLQDSGDYHSDCFKPSATISVAEAWDTSVPIVVQELGRAVTSLVMLPRTDPPPCSAVHLVVRRA